MIRVEQSETVPYLEKGLDILIRQTFTACERFRKLNSKLQNCRGRRQHNKRNCSLVLFRNVSSELVASCILRGNFLVSWHIRLSAKQNRETHGIFPTYTDVFFSTTG
jgi:hypothetical protein